MNTYVLGAGVSIKVGYPPGYELLGTIDRFVKKHSKESNRFRFSGWPILCTRLAENDNNLVRLAYRFGNFEQLMTVLDQYKMITNEFIFQMISSRKNHGTCEEYLGQEFDNYYERSNSEDRIILLNALAEFFRSRHYEDQFSFSTEPWSDLKLFGEKLQDGDKIITFNYDSCVERVLLAQGKWSPRNGYGFAVEFDDNGGSEAKESDITILHLHGATGWYKTPVYEMGSGRTISLDPVFLRHLGFPYSDATLPSVVDEAEIIIYPTYMKTYEHLADLWRAAADSLRKLKRFLSLATACLRPIQQPGVCC